RPGVAHPRQLPAGCSPPAPASCRVQPDQPAPAYLLQPVPSSPSRPSPGRAALRRRGARILACMSETTKVAVVGAAGRMGQQVAEAVTGPEDLDLVARIDVGQDVTAELTAAGAQVAVELTVPSASRDNARAIRAAGAHAVAGPTGWTEDALTVLRADLETVNAERPARGEHALGVLVAPNYAMSAVLAMAFAKKAAPYFTFVEVIELHHPNKVDAPSGTAI